MEYYAAERKELLPFATVWMELERNKPGGERQIPYDLTFNWNLINKTNKQAKYNQDSEIKNKLTVTRGEVGGDNEGKAGRVFKNMCKECMGKATEG